MNSFDERLRGVFAETFEISPQDIRDDLSMESCEGWDSMRSIVLATSLEEEFSVSFSDEELLELDSFSKFREALLGKGLGQ